MADVIDLSDYRNQGNGAREVLGSVLERLEVEGPIDGLSRADQILAMLWYDGFMIVPLTNGRETEPSERS